MVRHYSDENIPANALAPELAKIVLITLATSILMSVSILIFNYKKLI
jgi:1,4-dihydroxy-2-naphthoate octaprenyltransferase